MINVHLDFKRLSCSPSVRKPIRAWRATSIH